MILDNEVRFNASTGYSPTAQTDNIFPNSYDTSPLGLPSGSGGGTGTNTGRDFGIGTEMWIEVLILTTATSGGAATVNFQLVTDSTVTITTVNVLAGTGIIALANLTAKSVYRFQFPAAAPGSSIPYKQWINMDALIGTTTLTAGTFDAKAVRSIQAADLTQSGFAVS